MSVLLAEDLIASGRSPESLLAEYQGFGLVSFTAEQVRKHEQGVVHDPVSGEPAHALVTGNKNKTVKKMLARNSQWVVLPN